MTSTVISVLNIIFVVLGAYLTINTIIPILRNFILSFSGDRKSVYYLEKLLVVFVVLLGIKIGLGYVSGISGAISPYVRTIGTGLNVIMSFFDYIKWILVALVAGFALKSIKLMK